MNFLQNMSAFKKFFLAYLLITCFALTTFGQVPQDEGKRYGDPTFVGEPINLNVVNADIRDILNYITEQYGINFVIDKSVGAVPVTVNVNDVPWNIALDSILMAQGLAVQVKGPILRIAQATTLAAEVDVAGKIRESQLDTSPLYTEFIRLNYARAAGTLSGDAGGANQTTTGSTVGSTGGGVGAGAGGADQGILGIVRRRLSRRGAVEVDGRSNTLIVTDVRENIDAIRQLVMLLDQPEPQVEIEARIVVATRNFSRDIGVQLAALVLGSRGSLGSVSTLPGSTDTTGLNPRGIPTGIGIHQTTTCFRASPIRLSV